MFDRERQVEVTTRPGRRSGDDRLCKLGVRKGVVPLEHQAKYFEVAPLALDVLGAGVVDAGVRRQERYCGVNPESYPGESPP
jgi:hypothetical protein